MGRRKKTDKQLRANYKNLPPEYKKKVSIASQLKEETKHTIIAVFFFALSAFFFLAGYGTAGKVGMYTYGILSKLFGQGYYLIPVLFLLLGGAFLKSIKPNFVAARLLGGVLFFLAGLGMISIFWEESGGVTGKYLSRPLLNLFDVYFSVILLGAILIVSLLVMFDAHFASIGSLLKNLLFKKKEVTEGEEDYDEDIEDPAKFAPQILDGQATQPTTSAPAPAVTPAVIKDGTKDDGLFSFINFGKRGHSDEFVPPPLSLLGKDSGKPNVGDIKANSNIIKRTLANFGINVEMDEISIGPSVTRYALKPAEGVKLSRIVALQNDLSLSLAAHPLRIEAPIPGKALVGIEIPNKTKSIVGLASLIGTKDFADSHHPLYVSLGRGISGVPHFSNLAKAPHMLIAGATGSGKSVTIHTVITSLLYRNPPDKMRFIMIDPKRVELTLYNKIPHLLTPVITDAKKAILALKWAAKEMDRRYNILEAESVRDIQSYHKNVLEPTLAKNAQMAEGVEVNEPERMPYIVIIIDELADIMTAYPRELEAAIVRLAQMSRAVGIHLILSTQRPSVEVITGLIKANIPSRIALQVASQIDSRTIIDMAGAEKLLGAGDMLYISGEMSKPIRVQSAFITEEEVKSVTKWLADKYTDEIPSEINFGNEEKSGSIFSSALGDDMGDDDDLYEDAREAVIAAGKASASYLQRKLKVGYARAARLLDMLEERGVIGAGEGAKPREVYGAAPRDTDNPEADMI